MLSWSGANHKSRVGIAGIGNYAGQNIYSRPPPPYRQTPNRSALLYDTDRVSNALVRILEDPRTRSDQEACAVRSNLDLIWRYCLGRTVGRRDSCCKDSAEFWQVSYCVNHLHIAHSICPV